MLVESKVRTARSSAARAEQDFYSAYAWCLNPILRLRDLFVRLREEFDRYPYRTEPWQQEESRVNLFLFVCGISCVVDDYLARRSYDLSPIGARFPRARRAVAAAQWALDAAAALYGAVADRAVARWRTGWTLCVDRVSELVASAAAPGDPAWARLRDAIDALATPDFPERLIQRRLPLPAAFRNQDLTHHDVLALAERFAALCPERDHSVAVIGPRTAGAYFAPLVKARLAALGWRDVTWLSLRPKQRLSGREQRALRALARSSARVLLVDEPPNTGKTFQLLLGFLDRQGVSRDRIVILAPRNAARPDWALPDVPLVTLEPREYHKARLLEPGPLRELLQEYDAAAEVRLDDDAEVDQLNARLRDHHRAGFHVRLKRVCTVRRNGAWQQPAVTRLFVKSVGWGWLGYHAYFAATRLAEFVPRVVGLRSGLLITEWVGPTERHADEPRPSPRVLGTYVARRARSLPVDEDPLFENPAYGWSGWRPLVDILRRPYGLYVGRLKAPTLRRALRPYLSPVPTLIDGRMRPDEWIVTDDRAVKTDFEHHSFGKTELNLVDPAHDLASAVLEFGLSSHHEAELLSVYTEQSGDHTVGRRLLLYKLLVGVLAMREAVSDIAAAPSRPVQEALHARYHAARNFLIDQTARYCGNLLPKAEPPRWSDRLFFLDLDGVFDSEVLGFPHTSPSGLAALTLLRSHGFAVVANTGRSIGDTRRYCEHYGLPGGVAELGAVFFDAVAQREVSLVDPEAAAQLAHCAGFVTQLPGVFIDPEYRYAVRAYRFRDERPVPLAPAEVEDLLQRGALNRLTFSPSAQDTIILPRGVDKGHAVAHVKHHLGRDAALTAAMGDSERDVPMLEAAELAFAPAGCSPRIRALAARGRCRVTSSPMQRGLLAAARELARRFPRAQGLLSDSIDAAAVDGGLVTALLRVGERPRLRQLLALLDPWGV